MQKEIVLEVWGDFACFSRPESKVERLSYPVMTPSAARGILSAVYSKPVEFYWQVKKIEVLRPIRYISFKRNEVINSKIGTKPKPILVEDTRETGAEHRTQRQSVVLKDVRYRITAEIIKRDSFRGSLEQLYEQAQRRINSGKCFYQPCYFDNPGDLKPIEESLDLGIMLYDVFDLHKFEVTKKAEPYISLFHAKMENGVIEIPEFDSELVLKP
jgi:CRISPR-associated protein Cas5d